jgi:hypothetical protein
MNKKLIIFCLALAVAAWSMPAYADFTVTSYTSIAAWPESPQIKCTPTPSAADAGVGETNWGPGNQVGQTFMVPSSFIGTPKLDKIAVKLSGPSNITLSVKLYDLWAGDFNDNYHGWGNGNQGTLSPVDLAVKGTLLLSGSWVFPGAASPQVYMFDYTGTQEVPLSYAEKYMFVLDRNTAEPNAGNMTWYRSGAYSYTDGDMYRDGGVNGTTMAFVNGAGREAGSAVYIPEPATIALLCLGGIALLRKRA